MKPIDIAPADVETVRCILREHAPGLEVRAFGSRVSWTARETSDLDIALLTDEPFSTARMTNLKAAFTKSYLPFRVDIVDWASTSENFRKVIEREHVVVLGKEESPIIDGWCECPLGELTDNFDFIRVPVKKPDRRSGHYPYYGASGIVDYVDDYLFEGEYLLIAEDGENLRTRNTPIAFLADGKFWVNNHAHIVRGNQKANTRYLMYALSDLDISGYLTGSTMPKLTKGNLDRISLLTPPLPEQRTIAHVLGTLDNKIQLNRRRNKTLEEMTQALFKSWFVDFAPVRSKMEGSDTGLPQNFADFFPDRLVDSEIGEIPDGWDVGCLADIASSPRRSFDPADICGGTPYIGLKHMPRHSIALIEWERSEKVTSNKSAFKKGEFLFGKLRPYFHKVGLAPVSGICSTDIVVISPNSITWSAFVLATISSIDFITYTNQTSTGTKMPRTSWKTMNRYALCLPPEPVVQLLQNVTEPMLYRIVTNIHHNRNLAALRDILLPKLVSGMLRVEDAAKIVATI